MATIFEPAPHGTRNATIEAFLDAAERLLVDVGYAAISTRRVAAEAGANQGLVHYYFGSMDELFVQVLERFTARLVARQRAMYAADEPFIEKWRRAWSFQEEDLRAGYSKIWMELQALSWNRPDLRPRVERVNVEWRDVLREAFQRAAREYGLDGDDVNVEALVSLTMTFGQGFALERLEGITAGHAELLAWIEEWLQSLEAKRRPSPPPHRTSRASRAARAIPTRPASSSATASASTGSPTARATGRSSSSRRGRSCTRACGRRRSATSPATSA